MEIADELTHQCLAYVAAATRFGGGLTAAQLDAYALQPEPLQAKWRSQGGLAGLISGNVSNILSMFDGQRELIRAGEPMSAFFTRVEWISTNDLGQVKPTPLGKAILAELNNPKIDISSDSPISVVIDPEDPLAYSRIFDLLANSDDGLIVDAHLRFGQIVELLDVHTVTRIMTSTRHRKEIEPLTARALTAVASPPEVRMLDPKLLHDRFFIPDTGDVLVFGSSLNSIANRPGVVTPITDQAASGAIRTAYADLWAKGEPIEPKTDET